MPFKISYDMIRNLIQDGDCLFCFGDSEMSKAIKYFTGDCTHVGMLEVTRGRVMVLEAVNEFRHYPLSNYLENYNNSGKRYPGKLFIGRIRDLTPMQASDMLNLAYGQLGKPYDWEAIGAIAWNETFGKLLPEIGSDDRRKLYCSESYEYCYNEATGLHLVSLHEAFVTPDQLYNSSKMHILYEVI